MAYQRSAFDEQNQPISIYPTLGTSAYENTRPQNIIQKILKNRRQFLSILPGILLVSTAVCPIILHVESWSESPNSISLVCYICFSIGAAVGAFLNGRLTVKNIYLANGILLLLCGIIITANIFINFFQPDDFNIVGIIVSSLIYGVNHLTVILHAVDSSALEVRGTIVRWAPYSLHSFQLFATFLQTNSSSLSFTSVGVLYIILPILVLIVTYFFTYNSFINALKKSQNENDIRREVHKIRNEPNQSERILDELKEMKLMLVEDRTYGSNIFTNGNMKPLLLVIGARILSIIFLNFLYVGVMVSHFMGITSIPVPLIIAVVYLIGWIAIFCAERISFNHFYYLAGIIWSISVLVVGVSHRFYEFNEYLLCAAAWAIFLGYSIMLVGVEAISYNQLSEAFPLNKRAGSIAFVTFVESIFQIAVFVSAGPTHPYIAVFLFGVTIWISCYLLKLMPNTHGKTLRKAREMFNDSIAIDLIRRKYESESMPLQSI